MNHVYLGDSRILLGTFEDSSIDLIYIDPPFGTGDVQRMTRKSKGQNVSTTSYVDRQVSYVDFLLPFLKEAHRLLKETGTLYLHLDWRNVHVARVLCDKVFESTNFLNEIIWSYDFGGRGKDRWPRKHDNILVYVKKDGKHIFNWDSIDRIPYAVPEMQFVGRSPEEAQQRIDAGKVPTDVWSMSIVGTASKERTGYPSQKPVQLVRRAVVASSVPGGVVMDFFAGSGTTGQAALESGRTFVLLDSNPAAFSVMKTRFKDVDVEWHDKTIVL